MNFVKATKKNCFEGTVETINLITSLNSIVKISWLIPKSLLYTSSYFHCSVQIHKANSKKYVALFPKNTNNSSETFKCGSPTNKDLSKNSSYFKESKLFNIPQNLACKSCVLQWSLETSQGNFYQCSDIWIEPRLNSTDSCPLNCSTGGNCKNGKCVCKSGFSGTNCENYKPRTIKVEIENYSNTIRAVFIIILLVLIFFGIAIGVYYWREEQKEIEKEKIHRLEMEKQESLRRKKEYEYGSYSRRVITTENDQAI